MSLKYEQLKFLTDLLEFDKWYPQSIGSIVVFLSEYS